MSSSFWPLVLVLATAACGEDYAGGGRRNELPGRENPGEQDAGLDSFVEDAPLETAEDVDLGDAVCGESYDFSTR